MNINAQELFLVKKNMKFGETTKPETTTQTTTEPPISAPSPKMNALDAQAQSNISFQAIKMPAKVQKGLTRAMIAAALFAGAGTSITSCKPEKDEIIQNVTVDLSAFTNVMQGIYDAQQKMLAEQKITNELLRTNNAILLEGLTNMSQTEEGDFANFDNPMS